MSTITSSAIQEFTFEYLNFKTLFNTPLQNFGLEELEVRLFKNKSRPYKLLFWTISPVIYFLADITPTAIELQIAKVEVKGLERLTSVLDVKGKMLVLPHVNGVKISHSLQLALITTGLLPLIPRRVLEDCLNQATRISSERIGNSLRRRFMQVRHQLGSELKEPEALHSHV